MRPRKYTDAEVAEIKRRFALFVENRPKEIARTFKIRPESVRGIALRHYKTKETQS
jgi:hypothetical protein